MAALPREGFEDLSRRLLIAWLALTRSRARRALFEAEAELGWLGWERVDFFDAQVNEEVKRVQAFENAQASLLNTSAELSGRKAAFDEELAGERKLHDEAQAALARQRQQAVAQLEEAETVLREKLAAVGRFDHALDDLADQERKIEAVSLEFMKAEHPSVAMRKEARALKDQLLRLNAERHLVFLDRAKASQESTRLEFGIGQLHGDLQRIDAAASGAVERLAEATRRVEADIRLLQRERKKSDIHMAHLDREKRKPYRLIGACLADYGIAPLNQPEVLEKVLALRERDARLPGRLADLRAACAAADPKVLATFYVLLIAMLIAIAVLAAHFLHG